jgi:TetR/AcrR family transcriptional repressor of nem operon
MARHKAFREDEVLERAMRRFWTHGYEATSIQDLVDTTGINRASLYGTFGDKERLFAAAVDHYLARVSAERLAILDRGAPASAAIRDYFEDLLAFAGGPGRGLGCLLTNTAVELAPHQPDVAERIRASFARVEDVFARTIERGQQDGDIKAMDDPRRLAHFLVGLIQGIRVLIRARTEPERLRDVVEVGLGVLVQKS